jgi:predicted transcriptional regulator
LDQPPENRELNLASEFFHRINRIISQDQTALTFPPNYIVRKAAARMREHGCSQVPVVTGEDETLVPKITDGMGLLC